MERSENHVECEKRPVAPTYHETREVGVVKACSRRRETAPAAKTWKPWTSISGCPPQVESGSVRQASAALHCKSAPCLFASTSY